ncbi:MAG: hypothetical protein ACLQDL_02430, partial [Spirochaetia bacterium]
RDDKVVGTRTDIRIIVLCEVPVMPEKLYGLKMVGLDIFWTENADAGRLKFLHTEPLVVASCGR